MQPWIDGNAHHFCIDDFSSFLSDILVCFFVCLFVFWQLQIQKGLRVEISSEGQGLTNVSRPYFWKR